ncbi:MAG: glycosyltransferase family 39 protein, partial [Chlorobium sp.]
ITTLLVLFNIGRRLKNIEFGLLWMLLYLCSVLPFFYFRSGIIDPWFNLFIFLGIYYFVRYTAPDNKGNTYTQLILSALFLGLAVLTKGPVGLLIFLIAFAVYLLLKRFTLAFTWKELLLFSFVLLIVGSFWFILQLLLGNYSIIQDFILYQIRLFQTKDAGHGGFLLYHFVILLVGVFPASLLALPTFKKSVLHEEGDVQMAHFFRWMMISFWVVLILFTMVNTKIVHYSSFCYFPLTFLAAWYMNNVLEQRVVFDRYVKILLIVVALFFGFALTFITLFDRLKTAIFPYGTDEFSLGSMQATSHWSGYEPLIGAILVLFTVLFCIRVQKKATMNMLLLLLSGSLFFISVTLSVVVPQVEKYSQATVIDFYKSKRGEECYIYPKSKSYAHYFYSERLPENKCADEEFLMYEALSKPCYFVLKNYHKDVLEFTRKVSDAHFLYYKNGFIFFVRYPNTK